MKYLTRPVAYTLELIGKVASIGSSAFHAANFIAMMIVFLIGYMLASLLDTE